MLASSSSDQFILVISHVIPGTSCAQVVLLEYVGVFIECNPGTLIGLHNDSLPFIYSRF